MKKCWLLLGILILLGGCSSVDNVESEVSIGETPTPDPSVEVEGIQAFAQVGADIDVPAGAENARYYILSGQIAEIRFSQNGVQYNYRASRFVEDVAGVQGEMQEVEDVQAVAGSCVIPIQTADGSYLAMWKWGEVAYSLVTDDSADVGMMRSLTEELARETMPAQI